MHNLNFSTDKKAGLNCMYTNADFLHNKLELIEIFAQTHNIDIIAISEIHDKFADVDTRKSTTFSIPGFSTHKSDGGRGVCLFIKNHIKTTKLENFDSLFSPSIFCRIHTTDVDHFVFGVIYRSPNASREESLALHQQIKQVSDKLMSSNEKLVLAGDFNYREVNWQQMSCNCQKEHLANQFLELVGEHFLTQFVKECTHTRGAQEPTLVDLIIANDHEFISNIVHSAPIGRSHHDVLSFNININTKSIKPVIYEKFNLNKADFQSMREAVYAVDWQRELEACSDVDECWNKIETKLHNVSNEFIPRIKINTSKIQRNFTAPDSLLNLIKLKRKAFKQYKRYRTASNYNTYAYLRNQTNIELRNAKKENEIRIAKEAKSNPKALFRYISSKSKPRETIPDLKMKGGGTTEGDQQKADELNTFFGSVFTEENDQNFPECTSSTDKKLSHVEVSVDEVCKVLKGLKPGKSPGPDGIQPRVLKELAEPLSLPLKLLFDATLAQGKIPQKWKSAEVRPIFKKGDKSSADNYRPVSLTSVVCKVFEKFIRDAMYQHLTDNNILSPDQFGFCSGRSCVTQLLVTANDWLFSLDNKTPVDAIYLDFSKAFDSVPHQRLIHKLNSYGIQGNLLKWVSDFLSDRSQYVTINDKQSDTIPVTSGVPQGSVLGPTLFVYYINDLPNSTDQLVRLFADDSKIYAEIKTEEDYINLQKGIDDLVDWSNKWLMNFNSKKCKVLHLGKNNPHYAYTMRDGDKVSKLDETVCEKDLGVNIDPLLDFEQHITTICNKGKQLSGMLLRNLTSRCIEILIPLFKALIRPHLEYGNAVWCPYKKKDIKKVEQIQRDFTKRIDGMANLEYPERLRKLKLPSLEFRRLRGDLIETFKITHDIYDATTTKSLLTLSNITNTRCHPYKLTKNSVKTLKYQKFFTNRIITNWNGLPYDIVTSENVNEFKNKIDNHFKNLMYQTDLEI